MSEIPRKKLIEVALPLHSINSAPTQEQSIRHGHPSTPHLWWARQPSTGSLHSIEMKGGVTGSAAVTATWNEILYCINKPDDFLLAIVEFDSDAHRVHSHPPALPVRIAFQRDECELRFREAACQRKAHPVRDLEQHRQ